MLLIQNIENEGIWNIRLINFANKIIDHISIFNENFEKQLIDYVMIMENKFYEDY